MKSTYPWLAWNDRPFVSADELMQVPASSSSQLLHDYSVLNLTTPNPYDGTIKDDGTFKSRVHQRPPATFADLDGTRNTAYRYNRQRGAFGHLLNFFQSSAFPATATVNNATAELTGAPNYSRLLDYVEVPSRYVGTETMLSPEIFNDNPLVYTRRQHRRRQRSPLRASSRRSTRSRASAIPGRVNLNTVTGRRTPPTASQAAAHLVGSVRRHHASLRRRQLVGLGDSATLLQFGHLGPAWRDVALSRRGYAQFNADAPVSPVNGSGRQAGRHARHVRVRPEQGVPVGLLESVPLGQRRRPGAAALRCSNMASMPRGCGRIRVTVEPTAGGESPTLSARMTMATS